MRQSKAWHFSVEDYERMNKMRVPQSVIGINPPVVLKKEWCYSAYQKVYL